MRLRKQDNTSRTQQALLKKQHDHAMQNYLQYLKSESTASGTRQRAEKY